MKKLLFTTIALGLLSLTSLTQAALFEPEALVKVKPGTCTLMVFQPDGLNPMPATDIIIMDAETAIIVHHGLSDEKGLFVVELDTGRYILAASGLKMAIIDVSATHELSAIRLILQEESLQVGGADGDEPGTGKDAADVPEEDKSDRKGGWLASGGGVAGTTAGVVAAGTTGFLVEKNNDGGGSNPEPEDPEVVTPPTSNPPPEVEPEDPPGPSEPVVMLDPCDEFRLLGGITFNPCFE